jgi:ribonuclease-3
MTVWPDERRLLTAGPWLAEVQRVLHVKFRNPAVLAEAFVHRSILNEVPGAGVTSNERLEFLGDAVLGAVVAHELFISYPEAPEGELTNMRAAVVQGAALASVARRLQLGRWLRLGRGEELAGGRDRDANLARVYEAVVGAVYLDRGYAAARRFVLRTLKPDLDRLQTGYVAPAKSRLQWVVQRRWQQPPVYQTVSETGPDHAKVFRVQVRLGAEVLGEGSGRSRRAAEEAAAAAALRHLEEHPIC